MYFEFEDCSTADNSLENGQQLRHQQLSSSTPARSGFIQSNLAIKSTPSPPLDLAGSSVPPTPSISPITGLSKANGVFAEPNLEQGYLSPSRPLQRRYSIHSDSNVGNHQPLYFRQLGGGSNSHLEDIESPGGMEEENVSLCDLALITKSKLSQMNGGSYIKALEDKKVDADIPVTPSFSKHSNSDLRREVLLASIHRSLSASSDDLKNLCRSPRAQPESISFDSYLAPQVGAHYDDMMTNVGGDGGGVPAAPRPSCSSLATSSVSTNITAGSSRATSISASSSDEQMSDNSFLHNLFDTSNSGSSLRQRVRRSLNMSYLPTETLSCSKHFFPFFDYNFISILMLCFSFSELANNHDFDHIDGRQQESSIASTAATRWQPTWTKSSWLTASASSQISSSQSWLPKAVECAQPDGRGWEWRLLQWQYDRTKVDNTDHVIESVVAQTNTLVFAIEGLVSLPYDGDVRSLRWTFVFGRWQRRWRAIIDGLG